jgi:hypothetical protein
MLIHSTSTKIPYISRFPVFATCIWRTKMFHVEHFMFITTNFLEW